MERYFKRKASSPDYSIHTEESACGAGVNGIIQSSNAQPEPDKIDYQTRVYEFVDCIRLILRLGWLLCGLKLEEKRREGYFVELVEFLDSSKHPNGIIPQDDDEYVPVASGAMQESLVSVAAIETTKAIFEDLGDDLFGIHYAGFYDVKGNHLIAIVLRYVDKEGIVKERFIGMYEVTKFSASSLKEVVDHMGLKASSIRGQSYDACSGVVCHFNELKDLIVGENKSAYHTHCSTKQLHSALVVAAGSHVDVSCCGRTISEILRWIGARCKKKHGIEKKEKEAARIVKVLTNKELSAEELHHFSSQIGNTRWGLDYEMLVKLVDVFFSVIEVLGFIENNGIYTEEIVKASVLLGSLDTFDFVFKLLFMKSLLGITNELSLALQKKDIDVVSSAMTLVQECKQQLQMMHEGWEPFLGEVFSFCRKYDISVPNMDEYYWFHKQPPRVTNLHHYCDKLFHGAIDSQLEELNNLFDGPTTELLLCAACLSPSNSFSAFDKMKLVKLAQFYPDEFGAVDCLTLQHQLEGYILDMRSDQRFHELNTLADLSRLLVETKKHIVYPSVYLLLKLVLLLPITAPTEERAFSAMELVETKLTNQICDPLMSDCLVTYIEREIFGSITNDAIIKSFESDD